MIASSSCAFGQTISNHEYFVQTFRKRFAVQRDSFLVIAPSLRRVFLLVFFLKTNVAQQHRTSPISLRSKRGKTDSTEARAKWESGQVLLVFSSHSWFNWTRLLRCPMRIKWNRSTSSAEKNKPVRRKMPRLARLSTLSTEHLARLRPSPAHARTTNAKIGLHELRSVGTSTARRRTPPRRMGSLRPLPSPSRTGNPQGSGVGN
jgi:hypothetical protein